MASSRNDARHLKSKYHTCANKGRGFYSKNIFSFLHKDTFWPNFVYFYYTLMYKIQKNVPILGNFPGAATI